MKNKIIGIITLIFLIVFSGLGAADVLPNPVPENQVFTTTSIIEAVGVATESTSVVWQIGDAGLTALPSPYVKDGKILSGSIAYVTYSDSITTNGGQISEVKSFSMDTHAKTAGLYNIETTKVLTYTSQNGSHLMGAESYVLDVAGNWSHGLDTLVCVFSKVDKETIPAFCNKVTASSRLTSVTTAQVETVGALTAVAEKKDVPARLFYEISVTPDGNSASGYADGIVSTTFTVSVMEGRSDGAVLFGKPAVLPAAEVKDCVDGTDDCKDLAGIVGWGTETLMFGGVWNAASPPELVNIVGIVPDGLVTLWLTAGDPLHCYTGRDDLCNAVLSAGIDPRQSSFWPTTGGNSNVYVDTNTLWTYAPYAPGSPGIPPILEGYDELAATLTYIDTATVAGGISTFNKVFSYQSGIDCANC